MNASVCRRSRAGSISNTVVWSDLECISAGECTQRRTGMRLLPVAAAVAALTFAAAVSAQQAAKPTTTKADCDKAKMKWDAKGGKDGKGACVAPAPAKPSDAP